MARPRAISGCTIIAVAENHATLPQKTDLTIPMMSHGVPPDKVGRWDCYGVPSRWKENEAIVVHLKHHTGRKQVVEGFIGFGIVNAGGASVVKNGLEGGDWLAAGQGLFDGHDDGLAGNGKERVVGVGIG